MGPFGFFLFRYSEQHVKGRGSLCAHSCLSVSPGLSRIAQNLKKGLKLIFVVWQYVTRLGDQ
jgi:hypothetical protein